MNDYTQWISEISASEIPQITICARAGNRACTFGIHYNERKSKRFSFSQALASVLELEAVAYLLPVPAMGVILISQKPLRPESTELKLRGNGGKTCCYAAAVSMIIEAFELDHTYGISKTFTDITFDMDEDNTLYAIVSVGRQVINADSEDELDL